MRTRERSRRQPDTTGRVLRAALAVAFVAAGCGGDGYGGGTPTTPTPGGGSGGPSTISILGDRGNQSFSPNPGSPGEDQMVTWRNADGVVHRIVLNEGNGDTGDIGAGATSRAIRVPAGGINYHCSIHPGMIGSIRAGSGDPPPPCTGQYC
jgi:plastocyanin